MSLPTKKKQRKTMRIRLVFLLFSSLHYLLKPNKFGFIWIRSVFLFLFIFTSDFLTVRYSLFLLIFTTILLNGSSFLKKIVTKISKFFF
jgi:hypothetical protein